MDTLQLQRLAAAALSAAALLLLGGALLSTRIPNPSSRQVIPSPRDTLLPFLTDHEAACLPYPPHLLPGARDVPTLYGTMRV